MKKILLLALILFTSAFFASGQTIKDRYADGTQLTEDEWKFENFNYLNLLNRQNELLTNKQIAMWMTLGGTILTSLTGSLINEGAQDVGTQIAFIVSAMTMSVGSIWFVVNEFALITNQKKINNTLTLRYGPNGIALQF